MQPLRRFQGDRFLPHKSAAFRSAIRRKLDASYRHSQIVLVAQGLPQCLAALHRALVWRHFGSSLRTVRSPHGPSEFVVACALRQRLPEFLAASPQGSPSANASISSASRAQASPPNIFTTDKHLISIAQKLQTLICRVAASASEW